METMWQGRFQKTLNEKVNDFNSSISVDYILYQQDIEGSIAHATMLGECGVIEPAHAQAIVEGLEGILSDLSSGQLSFDPVAEDIHMFVEAQLTKRLGEIGKRLHTGRSRNDQVVLDLRRYVDQQVDQIISLIIQLGHTLCDLAEQHIHTIMPGYTHLQRAQPITFGHHMMAYAQMFWRDGCRMMDAKERICQMPLGSGALASTTYPLDRQRVSQLLKMGAPTENSLDAVSDRDFCIEVASAIAMMMMHLSRFSEEIILWCSWEFRFIELDDGYATGSSLMPQKKNPDIAELVRGKSARTMSNLQTLLVMMKSLPLAYNKDMQEDKEAIFDSIKTAQLCLSTFTPMIQTMKIHQDTMRQAAATGFINATDGADYLVKKGMAFRNAYRIIGELVAYCMEHKKTLETLTLEEYRTASDLFEQDIFQVIGLDHCVAHRCILGGPAPQEVLRQIQMMRQQLEGIHDIKNKPCGVKKEFTV